MARFVPVETAAEAAAGGLRRVTLFQEPAVEGALLSFDVASGEILALVGGWDFDRSQFDRATQARRQPGSAFKPIIYAAALAKGYTASSILYDRPVVYVDETSGFVWRPQNYGKSFYGPITLREALARSVNNATVHLFRDIGVDYVISFARSLGIRSPLQRDLSLALGSSGLSLLELTRAYDVFAAGGRRVIPSFIRRVTDASGQVLLEKVALEDAPLPEAPPESRRARRRGGGRTRRRPRTAPGLSPEQAYLATDLLRAVITDPQGTGGRARELARPIAGKTGTTNEQADAWFIGFSPDVITGVWVGHDESRFLGWGETGARAALPIWIEFMHAALDPRPARDFPVPESIVFARVDRKTGLLADASSSNSVFQAYPAGAEPTESVRAAEDTAESRRAAAHGLVLSSSGKRPIPGLDFGAAGPARGRAGRRPAARRAQPARRQRSARLRERTRCEIAVAWALARGRRCPSSPRRPATARRRCRPRRSSSRRRSACPAPARCSPPNRIRRCAGWRRATAWPRRRP